MVEVIELGLTGTCRFSTADPKPKEVKTYESNPLSQRVKADAEVLLMAVLNHIGNHPVVKGPTSLSTLVTEEILFAYVM